MKKEWELHNIFYKSKIMKGHTKDVDLDNEQEEDFSNNKNRGKKSRGN